MYAGYTASNQQDKARWERMQKRAAQQAAAKQANQENGGRKPSKGG